MITSECSNIKKFLQLFAIFELVQKLSITILSISNPVLYLLSIKSGKFERLETHTDDWIFIKRFEHFLDIYTYQIKPDVSHEDLVFLILQYFKN